MRRSVTVSVSESGKRDNLVCPKPRCLGLINTSFNEPICPIRWQMSSSNQSDFSDSKAGSELLDIILSRASFLSMDLNARAEQLAKVDLTERLFIGADLLPLVLVMLYSTFKFYFSVALGQSDIHGH
ncbi:hypothetical protein POM88_033961 [Heracleum sosnowskyi]|uniref:Uncharacterized protein n=1 Tax=Heracleum sosnowskyi TaxID=360622 RepID=A0AAD8HIQ7_9APIA|nr:hypothetical protein POM88_033961 [Heracleum sosnowskyi]